MGDSKISELLAALKLDENRPNHQFICVEELNNADGSFVLSSIIKDQIQQNNYIILILCHNSFGHFHAISQKLDYNLMSLKASGEVFVVDILERIVEENVLTSKQPLKDLYGDIKRQIDSWESDKGVCIVLESIGNLLLVDLKETFTFINYLRALILKRNNLNIACSIHNFPDCVNMSKFTKSIRHIADINITLKDLETGNANDVSGHLIVSRREKNYSKWVAKYQYQLLDRHFRIFAPGSRNFL